MNNRIHWIHRQVRIGWIFLAAGLVVGLAGVLVQRLGAGLTFNPRIITGLGILLVGIGIAYLVRYWAAARDPQAAKQVIIAERDERMRAIRARAGHRAYWVSTGLAYALLMWVSLSQGSSLPPISGDLLWGSLVVVVILPFGVFAANILYDQSHG